MTSEAMASGLDMGRSPWGGTAAWEGPGRPNSLHRRRGSITSAVRAPPLTQVRGRCRKARERERPRRDRGELAAMVVIDLRRRSPIVAACSLTLARVATLSPRGAEGRAKSHARDHLADQRPQPGHG